MRDSDDIVGSVDSYGADDDGGGGGADDDDDGGGGGDDDDDRSGSEVNVVEVLIF